MRRLRKENGFLVAPAPFATARHSRDTKTCRLFAAEGGGRSAPERIEQPIVDTTPRSLQQQLRWERQLLVSAERERPA